MARDKIKGITIEIAGDTSKLTKAITETKKSLVDTQKELNSVNKLLKFDPSNTTLLKQKQELLTKAISDTEKRLESLKELQKQFGDTSKLTDDQKEKYRYLEREIAQCESQLKNFNEEQQAVNKGQPFKEVTKDVEELGQKSLKTGDIIKANLVSQAIISGVKSLASAFKSAVNTLDDWSKKAKELEEQEAKVSRVMKNTTNASQKEIDALIELTADYEKLGVVSQETQLAGLQELGTYVSQKESLEKLLPVMNDMIAQQYGIGASMESASGIATMMGKVLGNGQVDALSRLGYKFDESQKKILKYGKEEKKVAMLSEIIQQSVGGMNQALAETDAGKLEIAASYFDDMRKSAGKAFTTIKAGLADTFMDEIENVATVLDAFFKKEISIDRLIEGLGYSINEGLTKLNNELVVRINRDLPGILIKIGEFVSQNLPLIFDLVLRVVLSIAKALGEALPDLIPTLIEGILNLVDVILDNIDLFVDAAIELIKGMAIGLIKAIPILLEKVPEIIEKLIKAILSNAPKILKSGLELASNLGKGLLNAVPNLLKNVGTVASNVISKFKEGFSTALNIGKNIVEGIWNGIKSASTWLWNKIKGWVSDVLGWFADLLGIHSPSTVFRDRIGKNIGLGVAEGIEDTIGDVEKAMQDLSSGIEASVNPVINPTANSNPLILNIDKFYNNDDTDVQKLAQELEFYRRNSALAKGGN